MICVYSPSNTDYEKNGAAVLIPTVCTVKEEAGGKYELAMTHPIDDRGLWRYLVTGNIIKVPVPAAHLESAVVGENADIWKANGTVTVYASPKAPQKITYQGWYPDLADDVGLTIGMKVTAVASTSGGGKFTTKNYQLTTMPHGNDAYKSPRDASLYWTEIPSETPGAATVTTLKDGTEFFLVEDSGSWLYIQTRNGYQGYVQKAYCEFVRTETVEQEPERNIKEQLFRIYQTNIDTAKKTMVVAARHVSYDLMGNLIGDCVLTNVTASVALSRMHGAFYTESDCTIATNINGTDEDYTATLTWKNPISAMLDPDSGIVPHFQGKLIRDNWDFFIYNNEATDRGLRIEYGKNLKGVTWKSSTDKLINRIIPVAQKSDGSDLLLPEIWVDSPIIDSYPVVCMEQMKVEGKIGGDDGHDGTWTEETLLDHMREMAQKRFNEGCDKAEIEIKVDFLLLGDTEEYAAYRGMQKLFLYDAVAVRDANVDLDMTLQLKAYDWDCILERYNGITVGDVFAAVRRTVSGYNLTDGCIRFDKLSREAINKIKQEVS